MTPKCYTHRAATWNSGSLEPACGAISDAVSMRPSGYDCPVCLEVAPGLQLRRYLNILISGNAPEQIAAPESVKAHLRAIQAILNRNPRQ